jgi:hypothetical protein
MEDKTRGQTGGEGRGGGGERCIFAPLISSACLKPFCYFIFDKAPPPPSIIHGRQEEGEKLQLFFISAQDTDIHSRFGQDSLG